MPKILEEKLKRQVANKNWSQERKNAYVYGTLQKVTNWKPKIRAKKFPKDKLIKIPKKSIMPELTPKQSKKLTADQYYNRYVKKYEK